MQRVINFSGGKTSACMTILLYKPGDIVLFCDTGREHPKTYKFIHDFEANENIPVTWIEYPGVLKSLHDEEKNKGLDIYTKADRHIKQRHLSPFTKVLMKRDYKRIPNRMMRSCTEELKVNTAKRYLKSIGVTRYINFIGFRYDEPKRVLGFKERFKKVTTSFHLYDLRITKEAVNEYWGKKPYTLEIPSILGNCDLCFMKGKNVIISILRDHPELADKWIRDEEESERHFGHTYIKGISFKKMLEISQQPYLKQTNLFDMQPAFDCACTT